MFHPKYRPEIDGLRAIAVLSVIAFHVFPEYVTGGFIGVDIFFVISGYLISTIIYKSLDKKSFSFIQFYQHRVRRILPALLVVMAATYLFGCWILFPDELVGLGKHILGGSLFVSNIVLWNESGYFDKAVQLKALMHLWSLGIEEQFYLLWPVILILIWGLRKRYVLMGLMVVGSFGYCLYRTYTMPSTAFFSPVSRFWELGIGALCAYYICESHSKITLSVKWSNAVVLVAAIGLMLPIFVYSEAMSFPGFIALLPVLASAFVLGFIDSKTIIGKLLSNKILVGIGLISYPLYLWHWPILSFLHTLLGEVLPLGYRFLAVFATFLLALLTFFCIERPFRRGSHQQPKSLLLLGFLFCIGWIGYDTFNPNSFFELVLGKSL